MSQPAALLEKTEREVAGLLMAGLATRRGGREQMEALAAELSAVKLERLASELRALATGEDPAALAGTAFTCLAMARKFRERLLPWPHVNAEECAELLDDPRLRVALPGEAPDLPQLVRWMESGDGLLRAHAARLLERQGEEAVPELARLATKGTVAIRREAIAAMGMIGGEAARGKIIDLLGDAHCWRSLLESLLPMGQGVVPLVEAALAASEGKKGQETRRVMAAALLYRLGAYRSLQRLAGNQYEDPVVYGLALAARARLSGGWQALPEKAGELWRDQFLPRCVLAMARYEADEELEPVIQEIDRGPANEVRSAVRWMTCAGPLEGALQEHYLGLLGSDRSKDRDRAAAVLRGLAGPSAVRHLAAGAASRRLPDEMVAGVLAETGGDHAVGALLDIAGKMDVSCHQTLKLLGQLGDPGAVPMLLRLLERAPAQVAGSVEFALVAMGDGAAELLWREMREREGTPVAERIRQVLLQIKGPRARALMKSAGKEGVEDLIPQLGHVKLGPAAARSLARFGEEALEPLERVLSGQDLTARQNALSAVASMKESAARDLLFRCLDALLSMASNAADAMVCVKALELLEKQEPQQASPFLIRGLATGVYSVQEVSARALVKRGKEWGSQAIPLLGHGNPSVRARALEVVGKLEMVEAEEKAVALLSDSDRQVQMAAVTALGPIGAVTSDPRVADALGAYLRHDRSGWPMPVIEALEKTGRREAIPYLREFIKSGVPSTPGFGDYLRRRAEEAVRKIEATAPSSPGGGLAGRFRRLLGGK